jgi:hypothetical protein
VLAGPIVRQRGPLNKCASTPAAAPRALASPAGQAASTPAVPLAACTRECNKNTMWAKVG